MEKHTFSKIVDELIGLVSIEMYGVRGVLSGERLLVAGLREGATNIYSYDGSQLVKLNREPINGYVEAPYDADKVVIFRDVSRGKEQSLIYVIDVDNPGVEKPLEGMQPARIMGIAYDDERIAFTASTAEGNHLYIYRNGTLEKLADIQGLAMLTDIQGNLGIGIGWFGHPGGRFQLFQADLETGEIRVLQDPDGSVVSAKIAPSGNIVYAIETASRAELRGLEPGSGTYSKLSLSHDDLDNYEPRSFNWIGFTRDGKLVVVARKEGRSRIFIDGKHVEAPEGLHGAVYEWRGHLVTGYTSLSTPSVIIEIPSGKTLLSGSIPDYVYEALGNAGFTYVESFDGEKVPVFILESKRASKPGPTVVLVHGGPFSEDADAWDIFAASLALTGFHVIMPNYRGSTGYGEAWRTKIVGDPCGGELEDITRSALWAKEHGLASDLYVMGYSYGGYMTMCSLTRKPGLYKAGVAGASVVDWEMMYELSDAAFRQFINLMFAGKKDLWKERSPITYVDNLREPLCIIHPQNDSRTPLKPVLKFMELATEKGKTFEAHIAPDMGHAVTRIDDLVKLLLPAVLFLARTKD